MKDRSASGFPWSRGIAAAALLGFLWFLVPVFAGVLNIGNGLALTACAAVFAGAVLFRPLKRRAQEKKKIRLFRAVYGVLSAFFVLGLLWLAVLTACMVYGAHQSPPRDAAVVVLGSQVKGDQPSLDLMNRIETAVVYLKDHPEVPCVVSGGQGEGEDVSEASVMKEHLVRLGVEESRIYLEDTSTSTKENMQNSCAVLEREGIPKVIAVVTDEYHQFRAGILARQAGMEAYAVPVGTPWYIFSACYARELLAVTYLLVLG